MKAQNDFVLLERVKKNTTSKLTLSTVEYEEFYHVVDGFSASEVYCFEAPKEINGLFITKKENICLSLV